jgi:hypothetical protein
MNEASGILPPQPSAVIFTLAKQAAIKAVKRQLQAEGRKLSSMSQSDISALANEHLAQHRDALLAHTWQYIQSAPALRELYDREQRKRQRMIERNSKHMQSARSADL